jgi:hypothetical protein
MSYVRMLNNYIVIFCVLEAINVIITESPDLESLLQRKMITGRMIFTYLRAQALTNLPTNKEALVQLTLQLRGDWCSVIVIIYIYIYIYQHFRGTCCLYLVVRRAWRRKQQSSSKQEPQNLLRTCLGGCIYEYRNRGGIALTRRLCFCYNQPMHNYISQQYLFILNIYPLHVSTLCHHHGILHLCLAKLKYNLMVV